MKKTDSNPSQAGHAGSISRRKLAKAGIAVPVVASLMSKPVWASGVGGAGKIICSASALASGNMSPRPGAPQACTTDRLGYTPASWSSVPPPDQTVWDAEKGKDFNGQFGFGPNSTLEAVITADPISNNAHWVAAHFNILAPINYGVTSADFTALLLALGGPFGSINPLTSDDVAQMLFCNLNTLQI